ncbi:hypothetical protein ACHAPG_000031 [Botrytis cinerea]
MSEKSPEEISYFWKDAFQMTIFRGINPVGCPAFKGGHFNDKILEGGDPLKSLEELKNSKRLSHEERAVVENCIAVSEPLFDNLTYNKLNPLRIEYEDLWNEVKNLSEMLGNNEYYQSRCSNCMQRDLNIEYIFDENGALKRMVTDVVPAKELKPRLWDPKFHNSFMDARDKQSLPLFDKYTSDDEEYVVEPAEERNFGSSEVESKERVAKDSEKLAEQNEMEVRDGAKGENSDDVDEVAVELSDKFSPLNLISTDEKTQE